MKEEEKTVSVRNDDIFTEEDLRQIYHAPCTKEELEVQKKIKKNMRSRGKQYRTRAYYFENYVAGLRLDAKNISPLIRDEIYEINSQIRKQLNWLEEELEKNPYLVVIDLRKEVEE